MKILHTADWHIGRTLYGKKRYEEFTAFLDWLAETILAQKIDALLVAGDIFDTTAPSNYAQELYYRFLCKLAKSPCRHVVVTAGNHDSPSFLDAPKELLKVLNVHVVGTKPENLEDEVLLLHDPQGAPELIVCAVPYLRDRDLRTTEPGETIADKERKILDGLRAHYAAVAEIAEKKRSSLPKKVPVAAMGHLFTAGGKTLEDDGVRELYVGSLIHLSASGFPESFDYLALGHLHIPQKVGDSETIRYSGSPIPMGFGEAKQQKSVCKIDFSTPSPSVELLPIPTFQKLEPIKGNWETIEKKLALLSAENSRAWLEITYSGQELIGDLRDRLLSAIAGTEMEILRIKNNKALDIALRQSDEAESLDDLNEFEVFNRCLAAQNIPEDQRPDLLLAYKEIVSSLRENDTLAR